MSPAANPRSVTVLVMILASELDGHDRSAWPEQSGFAIPNVPSSEAPVKPDGVEYCLPYQRRSTLLPRPVQRMFEESSPDSAPPSRPASPRGHRATSGSRSRTPLPTRRSGQPVRRRTRCVPRGRRQRSRPRRPIPQRARGHSPSAPWLRRRSRGGAHPHHAGTVGSRPRRTQTQPTYLRGAVLNSDSADLEAGPRLRSRCSVQERGLKGVHNHDRARSEPVSAATIRCVIRAGRHSGARAGRGPTGD